MFSSLEDGWINRGCIGLCGAIKLDELCRPRRMTPKYFKVCEPYLCGRILEILLLFHGHRECG